MPDLVRDVFDEALGGGTGRPRAPRNRRPFDVAGLDEDSDIAMSAAGERPAVAVVNYKNRPVGIDLRPLGLEPAAAYTLTDLRTGQTVRAGLGKDLARIGLSIPAVDFICLSLVRND